jgi:hypothetical protein
VKKRSKFFQKPAINCAESLSVIDAVSDADVNLVSTDTEGNEDAFRNTLVWEEEAEGREDWEDCDGLSDIETGIELVLDAVPEIGGIPVSMATEANEDAGSDADVLPVSTATGENEDTVCSVPISEVKPEGREYFDDCDGVGLEGRL